MRITRDSVNAYSRTNVGTAALLGRLQNGHVGRVASANQGTGLVRPRQPGRGVSRHAQFIAGTFTPRTRLSGYPSVGGGETSIPYNSADRLAASVQSFGAAGTRGLNPGGGFAAPGVIGARYSVYDTPAAGVLASSYAITGPAGWYGYALPQDAPAPPTPATRATLIAPGSSPRTLLPLPPVDAAPMLVSTPAAPGTAWTFDMPISFESGSTDALGPAAPQADYAPTGANGDTGATRIIETAPSLASESATLGRNLTRVALGAIVLVALLSHRKRK